MAHLLEKLKSPDVEERRDALEVLISRTVFDWVADREEREIAFAIPDLAVALSDDDSKVRELAIRAVRIQQREFDGSSVFAAIPSVIGVLLDPKRENIRSDASVILRDAVVDDYDISKFLEELSALLSDPNESVKFGIADSLTYYYAVREKWDEVGNLLRHPDKDVRQEAAGTLGRYETRRKIDLAPIVGALKELLVDENKEVRFVVARSLIKYVDEPKDLRDLIAILLEFSSDPERKISNNAVGVLGDAVRSRISCTSKFSRDNWQVFDPVIQRFEKLVEKGNLAQRKYVAKSLTNYYVHSRQFDKVDALLQSKNPKIRVEVVDEFCGCGYYCEVELTPLIAPLTKTFLSDEDNAVHDRAQNRLEDLAERKEQYAQLIFDAITEIGYDLNEIWKFIEKITKKIHQTELNKLADELESANENEKTKLLHKSLETENATIRAWAAFNLFEQACYFNLNIVNSLPRLINALEDQDPFVLLHALEALSQVAKDASIKAAVPKILRLLAHELAEIRQRALTTLTAESKNKSDISEAYSIIGNLLLTDPSSEVRARAAIFFYDASEAGAIISQVQEPLIEALEDDDSYVRHHCAWTFARFLMNRPLAERLLKEIKNRNLKKDASIRELIKSCKKALKEKE